MKRKADTLPKSPQLWMAAAIVTVGAVLAQATAAPQINNLSLRGLQTGAVTTITIDGADLLPKPRLVLPVPIASQGVKEGATNNRIQIEVTLSDHVPAGIYQLRLANAKGISNPVAVGIDGLVQLPLAAQASKLPVAFHGTIADSAIAQTAISGKKGERVVVEVEARRLGAALDPIVELSDARRVRLAWAQGSDALAGDARLETVLPADGQYIVELRDILYKAGNPGFYRLKIGDLRYADLVFPLGGRRGAKVSVELIGHVPNAPRVEADLSAAITDLPVLLPRLPGITGSAPRILAGDFPEVIETDQPKGKLQEVPVPAVINGRISKANEEDRYRLLVKPGTNLRFEVVANRAGSPLDGVLAIRNEAGAPLAANDDRPNLIDPGLDYTVPAGAMVLVAALKDLHGRGGANYVYRLSVTPAGQPDFTLTLFEDRHHVPQGGSALVRVRANRAGYNGPIKLSLPGLPEGVTTDGAVIPAGATDALLTLTAPHGRDLAQTLVHVIGESADPKLAVRRAALLPETSISRTQPWLRTELAVAVTEPGPFGIAWDTTDPKLPIGASYPAKVKVTRTEGVKGSIRLSLFTSQIVPKTKPAPKSKDPLKDDIARALRFKDSPTIAADQTAGVADILVPADLPPRPYDLAIRAELLGADGKTVLATAVTPSRRLTASKPTPPAAPPAKEKP